MRKLLLSLLLLIGACSNTPTNNLPPEQCRFVERVQLDPPGTYHVHETYPNITCEINQFGHINFITNMPVGWISPDSDAGNQTNWETFLVINGRAISTAFHRGMYAGLSFPQSVDGGVATTHTLSQECSVEHNQYAISTRYVEFVDSTDLLPTLLSAGTQLRVRIDICEPRTHDTGERNCIRSNEETLTVVVDRDPERPECNQIDPTQWGIDPGSY